MASIRERPTKTGGSTWAVLYRHNGKQTSTTFPTEKGAQAFVALVDVMDDPQAALDIIRTGQRPPEPATITLDQLAERWFDARQLDVAAGELTPRVLKGYRRDYANWIGPWLGHKAAADVTELDVQNLVDHMRTKIGAKSVADRHALLHGIYKWGAERKRRLVEHNPCKETRLPARTAKPPKGLRLPELHALTTTARKMYPDAADLIDFISGTGWRLGEAMALTVGQVEDDGTSVYVTMERVWRREVGFIASAKSEAGLRRLRILGPGVAAVRRRVVGKAPSDLVFTKPDGRPWDESTFRRDYWKKISISAGLGGGWNCAECDVMPTTKDRAEQHARAKGHRVEFIDGRNPTPHWLRHSHVFVCHAAGMSLAEIRRRVGHRDIQMTVNVYGRLIDDMSDDVAARLDALLTPGALPQVVTGSIVEPEALADQVVLDGPDDDRGL